MWGHVLYICIYTVYMYIYSIYIYVGIQWYTHIYMYTVKLAATPAEIQTTSQIQRTPQVDFPRSH